MLVDVRASLFRRVHRVHPLVISDRPPDVLRGELRELLALREVLIHDADLHPNATLQLSIAGDGRRLEEFVLVVFRHFRSGARRRGGVVIRIGVQVIGVIVVVAVAVRGATGIDIVDTVVIVISIPIGRSTISEEVNQTARHDDHDQSQTSGGAATECDLAITSHVFWSLFRWTETNEFKLRYEASLPGLHPTYAFFQLTPHRSRVGVMNVAVTR